MNTLPCTELRKRDLAFFLKDFKILYRRFHVSQLKCSRFFRINSRQREEILPREIRQGSLHLYIDLHRPTLPSGFFAGGQITSREFPCMNPGVGSNPSCSLSVPSPAESVSKLWLMAEDGLKLKGDSKLLFVSMFSCITGLQRCESSSFEAVGCHAVPVP